MINSSNMASKKRILLSWYIDLMIFVTIWTLGSYFVKLNGFVLPSWLSIVVFTIFEIILVRTVGSVGARFLSIDNNSKCVDPFVKSKENRLTILIGVLLILEGTKQMVRWTEMNFSAPFFGFVPNETVEIVIHLIMGLCLIISGYWYLKMNVKGLYLSLTLLVVQIISDVLSWKIWDLVIPQMVKARRELQGISVRDGEIAMMQSIYPEVMVVGGVFFIVLILFTMRRFPADLSKFDSEEKI